MSELAKREDRLTKYMDYLNPDVTDKPALTEKEEEIWLAIHYAYEQRTLFKSPDKVRKSLMTHGPGRSYSSACQLYSDMEYIYGATAEINKDAEKRIVSDIIYSRLEKLDEDTVMDKVEKEKLIQRWMSELIKLREFGDGSRPDVSKLMPKPNITFIIGGDSTVQIANVEGGAHGR